MFGISDLFQWERFVTPTVIKVFYWLAVVMCVLLGITGAVSSLRDMAFNPFIGIIVLITSLLGAFMGVIVARIVAETVLIVFRINEHLGAIRNQTAPVKTPMRITATRPDPIRSISPAFLGIIFPDNRSPLFRSCSSNQVAKRKCMTSPSCTT